MNESNPEMTREEIAAELRRGTRVILQVRHAERPKMDPDDPTFGDSLPITAEGIRTARAFGESFKEFRDVQFYASPLRRTRMTAEEIAAGMGITNPTIPTDALLGNESFYYNDALQVLDVFKPDNFFKASFEYFATGHQRGFNELHEATDALEDWLLTHQTNQLFIATTHDLYIAAFLSARGTIPVFSKENWPRFLDAAAILIDADGARRYALLRSNLSTGICGIGPKGA
jgi:broad specificity phosphatase PhoE